MYKLLIFVLYITITSIVSLKQPQSKTPSSLNVYRYEPLLLLEEPPIGTLIIDLSSKLGLNLDTSEYKFRFYSPTSIAAHYFLIDQLTGHVKTQRTIDREYLCEAKICGPCASSNCTLTVEIVAASPMQQVGADGSGTVVPKQKFLSFDVVVEDKNEFPPQFPKPELVLNISEAAPINFQIPLEPALDRDSRQSLISYSLAPLENKNESLMELNSRFRLLTSPYGSQLNLVILEPFDYEKTHEFSFKLLATDNGWPQLTGVCLITLKIVDMNDNLPTFDRQEYEYRADEGIQSGMRLLRVHASDKDDGLNGLVTYSFGEQAKSDFQPSDYFSIDESTGWISAKVFLDYEQMSTYRFTVKAQDHGANSMPVYTSVTIYLNDLNDNAPVINLTVPEDMFTFNNQQLSISEWTLPGTFLAQIIVNDLDSGANGQVKVELQQYEKSDHAAIPIEVNIFAIEHLFNNIYSLVLKHDVDREICSEYELIIRATDNGTPLLSTNFLFHVIIMDENDNKPKFVYKTPDEYYLFEIEESSSKSNDLILVGKVQAIDNDTGVNSKLTYELEGVPNSTFTINKDTGEIYAISNGLDREYRDIYDFKVKCKDGGLPELESISRVVIKLLDINDNAPKFTQDIYTFSVFEDLNPYNKFGRVNATDSDDALSVNSQVKYEIMNSSNINGLFSINTENGDLYLISSLDYESKSFYEFEVSAYDLGYPRLTSTTLIRVNVLDVNDNTPQLIWPKLNDMPIVFSMDSNQEFSIQINATDLDSNENSKLRYFIEKQQKFLTNSFDVTTSNVHIFEIDSNRGLIKGTFMKKQRNKPKIKTRDVSSMENMLGIYALEIKIIDSSKLNPLHITTNVFIVLNTNTTHYSEQIDLLKQFFGRDKSIGFTDRRILNLKNFIDNVESDQYLSTDFHSDGHQRFFSIRLFEKTSKLLIILIIFSSIMFLFIILSICVILCYKRQKKMFKEKNLKDLNKIKKSANLLIESKKDDQLNTSGEEKAALINTNSPASSSLLSNTSTRPSMKESCISNQTMSTTSMCAVTNTDNHHIEQINAANFTTFKTPSPLIQQRSFGCSNVDQKYTTLPMLYKNDDTANNEKSKYSSNTLTNKLLSPVRSIQEKNELNYASSESTDEYGNDEGCSDNNQNNNNNNNNTVPEYFFKDEKEYKTFLNKKKINCKHLVITGKPNRNNECFL